MTEKEFTIAIQAKISLEILIQQARNIAVEIDNATKLIESLVSNGIDPRTYSQE